MEYNNGTAGGRHPEFINRHPILSVVKSGLPEDTRFEASLMAVAEDVQRQLTELKGLVEAVRQTVEAGNVSAATARAEHIEMRRKLDDHEEILHGDNNLPLRVDRVEQTVRLAKWGLHLAGAMSGALAMLALEHFFH